MGVAPPGAPLQFAPVIGQAHYMGNPILQAIKASEGLGGGDTPLGRDLLQAATTEEVQAPIAPMAPPGPPTVPSPPAVPGPPAVPQAGLGSFL